jgi:Domain of unknown function (DUF5668)
MPSNNFTFGRCRSGEVAIPVFLIVSGAILLMNNFGMIYVRTAWDLWPLLLIAGAVENLAARVWRI